MDNQHHSRTALLLNEQQLIGKREFSSDNKLPNKRGKRRKNKCSHASRSASQHTDKKLKGSSNGRLAQQKPKKKKSSALVASQHTDKKCKDSSNVQLAQPKPKKKSPAQVARDHARRKEFWKRMQLPRQPRVENLALHY